MQYVLEGALFGLTLSILVGPIFIALTQSSIEKGYKAGLSVGAGIWISDLLFIVLTYEFVHRITHIVNGDYFQLSMGILGGIVLIGFGIYSLFSRLKELTTTEISGVKSYAGFFVKGFLVNTINPFTFVFWISVITTYVLAREISGWESIFFLGSILLVIIITDSLKVLMAQVLRKKLRGIHLLWINRVAGAALAVFGVLLIIWSV
ncbi:LysE family translocator [Portibacter marinus]|uniref:LysE family translocator n=1 Tax=Portibacter marinus TaxID=2898660 RepID=UPI001F465FE6|nr:LysE family translocator [Portibacter marinus]